jgi:hypothetical protein
MSQQDVFPDSAVVLPEPGLLFAYGQTVHDPHHGLSMFGPYDLHLAAHPGKINYAVIGVPTGVESLLKFLSAWSGPLIPSTDFNERIWPVFPGFETVFQTKWPSAPAVVQHVDPDKLVQACGAAEIHERVGRVVDVFLECVKFISKADEKIDVIICVAPEDVFKHCRPQSSKMGGVDNPFRRRKRAKGDIPTEYEGFAPDFRRQLKARAMKYNVPIQIIRESTLALSEDEMNDVRKKYKRGLTPAADRAWNLGTTIFYKGGGKPWVLSEVRDGVCYIGISYRLSTEQGEANQSACCAAQMFLQDGDGVIFRGDDGIWYSEENRAFHLKPDSAKSLLEGVLASYKANNGKPLQEVFLHCPSGIDDDEFQGFQAACPPGAKLIAVKVRRDHSFRIFRKGLYPAVRGTFIRTGAKTGMLWASGFKYQLATYDGTEVPVPLSIEIQHGDADLEQVAKDILGLTKLNYNACKFGESEPVTIGFSDAVGEILVSNPGTTPHPQFKFYI